MPIEEKENGTYIINSKDLGAIKFLKDLRDSGVISFKIEGRTKWFYFLSIATRAYRGPSMTLGPVKFSTVA